MQPESPTRSTPVNFFVEGLGEILKRDLAKHTKLAEQTKCELDVFRESVAHLVKRKRHFSGLVKEGKFNKQSMEIAIEGINVDIRAMSDKAKLAQEKLEHHNLIIDTLGQQLSDYTKQEAAFLEAKNHAPRN